MPQTALTLLTLLTKPNGNFRSQGTPKAGSEVSHFNHGLANGKEGRMAVPVNQESGRCH